MAAEMLCSTWGREIVGWEEIQPTHKRPANLSEADFERNRLHKEYIKICDEFGDGRADYAAILAAHEAVQTAEAEYHRLWVEWNEEKARMLAAMGPEEYYAEQEEASRDWREMVSDLRKGG